MVVSESQNTLLAPPLSGPDDTEHGVGESGSLLKHTSRLQEDEDILGEDVPNVEGRLLPDHERSVAERNLVRKLDKRLMPCIFIIYIMNYVSSFAFFSFYFLAKVTSDRC
jgi:hypothetical protein